MVRNTVIYGEYPRKPYGCLTFVFDVIMTVLTSGFWLIWVFVREMRRR